MSARETRLIKEMRDFTGASAAQARTLLERFGWDISHAADAFFTGDLGGGAGAGAGAPPPPALDARAIAEWFDQYKDADVPGEQDQMTDGIINFCGDIGIDAEDVVVLVISWYMKAENMCVYTREEFDRGMRELSVDSPAKLKEKIDGMRALLVDPESFKDIYAWTFNFAKESGKKVLPKEVAVAMWKIILAGGQFRYLDQWCEFVEAQSIKYVNKDMWTMCYEFAQTVADSLDAYDENGAWPCVIDDFVEHLKKQPAEEAKDAGEQKGGGGDA